MHGDFDKMDRDERIKNAEMLLQRGQAFFFKGDESSAIEQYHLALLYIGAQVPKQPYTGKNEDSYGEVHFEDIEDPVLAGRLLVNVAECYFRPFYENIVLMRNSSDPDYIKNFVDPFGLSHGHALGANNKAISILEKCLDHYVSQTGFVGLYERRQIANLLRQSYDLEIDDKVDFAYILKGDSTVILGLFVQVLKYRSLTFLEALWLRRNCMLKLASEEQAVRLTDAFKTILERWNAIGLQFGYLRDALKAELKEQNPRQDVVTQLDQMKKRVGVEIQEESKRLQSIYPVGDEILSPLFDKFMVYPRSNEMSAGFIALSKFSPHDVLIQYHETSRQLVAFICDLSNDEIEDKVSMILLSRSPDILMDKVQNFNEQVKRRSATWMQTASELYLDLIAPLSPYMRDKNRFFIVPSGLLNTLPFQILIDPRSLEVPRINFLPHAELVGWIMSTPVLSEKPANVLVIGIDHFKTLPLLENAESEARYIAAIFGKQATVLLGTQGAAVKDRILREMNHHAIIHVASHASFDRRAMNSAIFVKDNAGNDIPITGFDLLRPEIRLDGALIVLSACNTGGLHTGRGEDPLGLASALFIAGARTLLVSYWPVSDKATEIIMGHFYTSLTAGETVDSALLSAIAWIRKYRTAFDMPYYWGAFVVMGDGRWRLPQFETTT